VTPLLQLLVLTIACTEEGNSSGDGIMKKQARGNGK
jgi:hypothetical protein